jgi:hypothetical protein
VQPGSLDIDVLKKSRNVTAAMLLYDQLRRKGMIKTKQKLRRKGVIKTKKTTKKNSKERAYPST